MLRIQLYHPRNEFIFKIYFDQILAALISIRDLFPTSNTHIHTLQRVRELQKLLEFATDCNHALKTWKTVVLLTII